MEWLTLLTTGGVLVVLALVVAVAVAIVMALLWRGRARGSAAIVTDEELFGEDAAELEAVFRDVEVESLTERRALVRVRLSHLRSHRVPLRHIRSAPGPQVARLGFADGTVLLARSADVGDLGTVVRLHHRGGLVVADFDDHPQGVAMHLAQSRGRGRCTLIALGLDQSD